MGPPLAMVGSFYDSVDNLLVDPDADELEDITWCARRCIHPVKDVADKYGLSEDDLKGHLESYVSRTEADSRDYESKKRKGKTNDLCVYWKNLQSRLDLVTISRGVQKNTKTYLMH